jgi:hypothetical protein
MEVARSLRDLHAGHLRVGRASYIFLSTGLGQAAHRTAANATVPYFLTTLDWSGSSIPRHSHPCNIPPLNNVEARQVGELR